MIEDRTSRAMLPADPQPRAIAGRTNPVQLATPAMGSQCRYRAKTYCKSIATMNTGKETPSRENPMNSRSKNLFLCMAAISPHVIPTTHATSAAAMASHSVFMNAGAISSATGLPSV
jgi:hypothetical protein